MKTQGRSGLQSMAARTLTGLRRRLGFNGDFRVERLLDSARRQTGLADFGDQGFVTPLRLVTECILKAGLVPAALSGQRRWLVEILKRRLYIQRDLSRHPEILAVALERPIFVVGMPRSGTTLLHNLLLTDQGCRWLREWEVEEPWPERRGAGEDPRERSYHERIARSRTGSSNEMDTIHAIDSPADCDLLLLPTFYANLLAVALDIPDYERWLLGLSWEAWAQPYEYYRRELQRLLWYGPGGRWVLKSPVHLGNLRALSTAFPDARILHIHRDPARAVPSTCSMVATVRKRTMGKVDRPAIGQFILTRLAARVDSANAAREALPATVQIQDVQYLDLLRDPLGTMERIYGGFGMPLGPEGRQRMEAWLRDNPQHKRGVHRYAADDFGLSRAQLDRAFAAYRERSQVQAEPA